MTKKCRKIRDVIYEWPLKIFFIIVLFRRSSRKWIGTRFVNFILRCDCTKKLSHLTFEDNYLSLLLNGLALDSDHHFKLNRHLRTGRYRRSSSSRTWRAWRRARTWTRRRSTVRLIKLTQTEANKFNGKSFWLVSQFKICWNVNVKKDYKLIQLFVYMC